MSKQSEQTVSCDDSNVSLAVGSSSPLKSLNYAHVSISGGFYDRNAKVAKKRYSDHGSHGKVSTIEEDLMGTTNTGGKLVKVDQTHSQENDDNAVESAVKEGANDKNVTLGSNVCLSTSIKEQHKGNNKKRLSPSSLYSHESKFPSNLQSLPSLPHTKENRVEPGISDYNTPLHLKSTVSASEKLMTFPLQSTSLKSKKKPAGLLEAALRDNGIKTKNDADTIDYLSSNKNKRDATPGKGKCLTSPSEPESNGGRDNAEGNLIVHINDILRIPKQNIRDHNHKINDSGTDTSVVTLGSGDDSSFGSREYQIVSLLGQGTFAQVFKCRDLATGKHVAVKIVKNKPAYTRQATVEIDIFQALAKETESLHNSHHHLGNGLVGMNTTASKPKGGSMVNLLCYFLHHSHLCLVFELLGLNLYEILKKRQFRGLPMGVVRELVSQAIDGICELGIKGVVHCDLKPENILIVDDETIDEIVSAGDNLNLEFDKKRDKIDSTVEHSKSENASSSPPGYSSKSSQKIKLIDFGSACFEGQTAHTYIQSRFYRSPEVLVGLDYDSAIDMWSLGCVAAELYLGLPILPGVHEHDQLSRISEMIGKIPDWMLEQGSKCPKYYIKSALKLDSSNNSRVQHSNNASITSGVWRLRTREDFIKSLSDEERERRGGLSKLEQEPTKRYFNCSLLEDIILSYRNCTNPADREKVCLFVHFLKGILDPDPWKRWTARQASMHPFITGNAPHLRRTNGINSITQHVGKPNYDTHALMPSDIFWTPDWDPSICRRKLFFVQKAREKQNNHIPGNNNIAILPSSNSNFQQNIVQQSSTSPIQNKIETSEKIRAPKEFPSPEFARTAQKVTAMTDAMTISKSFQSETVQLSSSRYRAQSNSQDISPPASLASQSAIVSNHPPLSQAFGSVPLSYETSSIPELNNSHPVSQYHATSGVSNSLTYNGNVSSLSQLRHQYQDISLNIHPSSIQGFNNDAAELHYGMGRMPEVAAAQSYSGVYYDGNHNVFVEGDLGYALQRPGVVPEGGDLGMVNSNSLHHTQVQQQQPLRMNRSSSLSSSHNGLNRLGSSSGSGLRRRGTVGINPSSVTSLESVPATMQQTPQHLMHNAQFINLEDQYYTAPNTRSLLAQQLADHSNDSLSSQHNGRSEFHNVPAPHIHSQCDLEQSRLLQSQGHPQKVAGDIANNFGVRLGSSMGSLQEGKQYMENPSYDISTASYQQQKAYLNSLNDLRLAGSHQTGLNYYHVGNIQEGISHQDPTLPQEQFYNLQEQDQLLTHMPQGQYSRNNKYTDENGLNHHQGYLNIQDFYDQSFQHNYQHGQSRRSST
mmetsp:Transcript_5690/g.8249  ORF Transcript_5690/g.8249 Transcript_5690/m.8249 type:complete len:1322 (+) Transcript_5690:203-4168(+)